MTRRRLSRGKNPMKKPLEAHLVSETVSSQWPEWVARLAGAWPDFPTAEEICAGVGKDVPRELL